MAALTATAFRQTGSRFIGIKVEDRQQVIRLTFQKRPVVFPVQIFIPPTGKIDSTNSPKCNLAKKPYAI